MLLRNPHPSLEESSLVASGELSGRKLARVRGHLGKCHQCRAQVEALGVAMDDFARVYRSALDPHVPPMEESRARLKARMSETARTAEPWEIDWRFAAVLALAVMVVAGGSLQTLERHWRSYAGATPRVALTPGATRTVSLQDVCPAGGMEPARVVPASLRERVLEEYGMSNAEATSFEVDYLITPELGGADDIRNLWPQPYASTIWNAHVKDVLEERLHRMVCDGELDLATAQREIATDWIGAYKKYFHTNRPLENHGVARN